jgi:hypothetical protein
VDEDGNYNLTIYFTQKKIEETENSSPIFNSKEDVKDTEVEETAQKLFSLPAEEVTSFFRKKRTNPFNVVYTTSKKICDNDMMKNTDFCRMYRYNSPKKKKAAFKFDD